MEQIQQTKPLEFSTNPLFTTRNLMVILEVEWFEYPDNCINTFHVFLSFFNFSFGLTQYRFIISVSVGQEFRLQLSWVVCTAVIKVLVKTGFLSKAQLGKNLLPSSRDC